jgi:hypothetical protein
MRVICGSVLLCGLLLQADTLYLRDGRTIKGTFISGNSREVRFLPDRGRTQSYTIGTVDRISFTDGTAAASQSTGVAAYGNSATDNANSRRRTYGTRERADESVIPGGTVVTVSLIDAVDSNQTDIGRRYRASLDEPIVVDGRTVAQKGADATVEVVRVDQSGTVSGREEIALALTEVNAGGRTIRTQTQHAEVSAKSRSNESAKVIGGTAVVGAIIGAIAGGGKGAAIGAASGAGAGVAIQAIRGQRIQIPSETKLDFTLAQPATY